MPEVWSAPDSEPLDWFGSPPDSSSGVLGAYDPALVQRLRIRGEDLEFCRANYERYRQQQKKRVKGQGTLWG